MIKWNFVIFIAILIVVESNCEEKTWTGKAEELEISFLKKILLLLPLMIHNCTSIMMHKHKQIISLSW